MAEFASPWHLQPHADKYKAVSPGIVEGRTEQPSCCGIIKGDPVDRICSITTGATSECNRDIKHISFCTRRE